MTIAERRRRNRARVAERYGDDRPPPGLDGAEIGEIAALFPGVGGKPPPGAGRNQLPRQQYGRNEWRGYK